MFKELKVIKLIVIALLLLALIWRIDFKSLSVSELYTDKLSYFPGETVKIYTSTNSIIPLKIDLEIKGLTNDFSTKLPLKLTNQKKAHQDVLKNGLGYTHFVEYKIPSDQPSGIYSIHKTHPLVVRSRQKNDITVVYPAMNNVLYHKVGLESVYSEKKSKTNLLRSVIIDIYSQGIAPFFNKMEQTMPINYITDLDLEDFANFSSSRLVIVYGKSTSWTPEMKDNVSKYIEEGGNLLNITSYFANNICWHEQEDEIRLMDSTNVIKSWQQLDPTIPLSIAAGMYRYSGYSKNKSYHVVNKNHPIFQGLLSEDITIDGKVYQAPPVVQNQQEVAIDLKKCYGFRGDVLAMSDAQYEDYVGVKGIFVFQRSPVSGKVIVLGTEDWCTTSNIGSSEALQKITRNAIDFLLQ